MNVNAVIPSRRTCDKVLHIVTLVALLVLLCIVASIFGGCANNPQQQYDNAFAAKAATAAGLQLAYDAGKVRPTRWTQIGTDEEAIDSQLAIADKWLKENPTLANTPGLGLPTRTALDIALFIYMADLAELGLAHPSPPATQPGK